MKTNKNNVLFEGKNYPVVQNIAYSNQYNALNCKTGDIEIVQDDETGLIYNNLFDETILEYTPEYDNEQGNSTFFKSHLDEVSKIILEYFDKEKKVVEIGCGKGVFLEKLLNDGYDIVGFDPTYEGFSSRIHKHFFQKGSFEIVNGIILRHVLEHIQNPVKFLKEIAEANGKSGIIYIEVPCLDWIIENQTWYDFYYEHVNYFRIQDFQKIFKNIISIGHVFNGQYIYLVAKLDEIQYPDKSENRGNLQLPKLSFEKVKNLDVDIVWGAGSKGIIFSMLMERCNKKPKFIVDINPNKIGKYAPVSGIKIISPSDCIKLVTLGSNIVVMNKNYLEEIKQLTNNSFRYISI